MESNETHLSVQDRLLAWVESRKSEVRWGIIVVLAAGLVGGFFLWRQSEKQTAANAALSSVAGRPFTGDAASELPEALLKVANEYAGTAAGGRALLLAAATMFTESKYPEAQAQFETYLREYRDAPFADQALLGVAACLDAEGKTNEAVAAYSDIIQHHSTENVAPQARFALARLYESQNRLQQAKDLYQELARAGAYGLISSEAGMRLQALLAQHPDLAPAVATSTNLPVLKPETP